jgi:hypothetical protein
MCVPSCRYWRSPSVSSADPEPGGRSTPRPSPTAGEPDCEQVLAVLEHCSVPVASRSRPGWVPEPAGAGCESAQNSARASNVREGGARGAERPEAGEDEVRCGRGGCAVRSRWLCGAVAVAVRSRSRWLCGRGRGGCAVAVAVAVRSRSNVPFVPDRVAVRSRSVVR